MALEQTFCPNFGFSPVSKIPPLLRNNSSYHLPYVISATDSGIKYHKKEAKLSGLSGSFCERFVLIAVVLMNQEANGFQDDFKYDVLSLL